MFIAKYKLEKVAPDKGATIPARITEGGYWISPIDNTMLGWYDDSNQEFYVPASDSIVKMTKQNVIDRALEINEQYPTSKGGTDPNDTPVLMTEQEIIDMMSDWCDEIYNRNSGLSTGYLPSNEEVNEERERRIAIGCNISIANVGSVYVTGTEKDVRNMSGLGQGALIRIMQSDTTPTDFRDGNNVMYTLTPNEMLELWQKSSEYISAIYQASWTIKAMNPIPQDYAADSYWPSNSV
jgi:hypothetical protein